MPISSPDVFNVVGDAVITNGGSGGAVDSVTGTAPISVSPTTGSVVVSLDDVSPDPSGVYNVASINVDSKGRVISAVSGTAVVSVTGTSPIASSGGTNPDISLEDVSPDPSGTFNFATVTVDSKGRVTSASTGTPPAGTVTDVTATSPISSTGGATPNISLDDLIPDPSGAFASANIIVDSKGRVTAAASGAQGTVTAVTGSGVIASSGGTTPDISHLTSGVSAGSYTQATISVDSTGHVTSATAGRQLHNLKGESNSTGFGGRNNWFVTQDYRQGTFIDTGTSSYTFSNDVELIRYPLINFQQEQTGSVEVAGYIIFGANVPTSGRPGFKISIYEATFSDGATTPTFTRVGQSANIGVTVTSNQMQKFDRITIPYTASGNDYLMFAISNSSTTQALSTSTCYVNMDVRFNLS